MLMRIPTTLLFRLVQTGFSSLSYLRLRVYGMTQIDDDTMGHHITAADMEKK